MPTKAHKGTVHRWVVADSDPDTIRQQEGRIDTYGCFYKAGFYSSPCWASIAPGDHFDTLSEALERAKEMRDKEITHLTKQIQKLKAYSYDTCDND